MRKKLIGIREKANRYSKNILVLEKLLEFETSLLVFDGLAPGDYYVKAGPGADPFDDTGAPRVRVVAGEAVDAPDVILP